MDDGPQETIAHYRITSKPGKGGMGEAWRATDLGDWHSLRHHQTVKLALI